MTPPRATPAARLPATALRPVGLPRPLGVGVSADGAPRTVARDVHGRESEAAVESIEEVWRVAEAWWRESPQSRTYYRVILVGGRPLTLFRDDRTGEWFEQSYSATAP